MSIEQIVALLVAERDRLNRVIDVLQDPARRRGRPPKNPAAAPAIAVPKRKRRTAAQRKAQAVRMKAYWAKRRQTGAK